MQKEKISERRRTSLRKFLRGGICAKKARFAQSVFAAGILWLASGCGGGVDNPGALPPELRYEALKSISAESPVDHSDGVRIYWDVPNALAPPSKYFVFRDDEKIGSTTNAYYTDDNFLGGERSYSVAAVYEGYESPASDPLTVDTLPAILPVRAGYPEEQSKPFEISTSSGSDFDILVRVEKVTELFGAAFELQFDASLISCDAADYDTDDAQDGLQNFLGEADALRGGEPLYADKSDSGLFAVSVSRNLSVSSEGVDGSGYIARVSCRANATGSGSIAINSDAGALRLTKSSMTDGLPDPIDEAPPAVIGRIDIESR